jgi:hypothetical protein
MSHRNKPPRMSANGRGPKVVCAHAGVKSLGTHTSRKTINDVQNGRGVGGSGNPPAGGTPAPGAAGPPLTDESTSSW